MRARPTRNKIYKDRKNLRFGSANVANQPINPQEENFKRCRINQTDWFNETPICTLQ